MFSNNQTSECRARSWPPWSATRSASPIRCDSLPCRGTSGGDPDGQATPARVHVPERRRQGGGHAYEQGARRRRCMLEILTYSDAGAGGADGCPRQGLAEREVVRWVCVAAAGRPSDPLRAPRGQIAPGTPVLLVYQPSLDFTVSFLACLRAGIIAVPVYPPGTSGGEARCAGLTAHPPPCCRCRSHQPQEAYRRVRLDSAAQRGHSGPDELISHPRPPPPAPSPAPPPSPILAESLTHALHVL